MREYSVKKMTITIFVFTIGTMFLGFYFFRTIGKNNLENYKRFVEINKKANKLTFLIDDCDLLINRYFNTNNALSYIQYVEKVNEINSKLKDLYEFSNKEKEVIEYLQKSENTGHYQEVLYYLRMVKNMNDYQLELVKQINNNYNKKVDLNNQLEYLRRYFNKMDANAKLLTQAYFDFTGIIFDGYYEDNEKLGNDVSSIVFFLSSIGLILIIAYLYGFSKVINEFEKMSQALSNHKWDVKDIKKGRYREFNEISEVFNHMKKAIINYIDEIQKNSKIEIQLKNEKIIRVEKEKLLNETKLLAFQEKMNPHFLFNTLNLIGSSAIHSDIELATELIEAISEILRYNLEFDQKRVELQREIYILEKYIFIQNSRWQNRIEFSILNEIEDNTCKIPPMLIQPLIENAIIHGMKNIVDNGIINVNFFKNDGDVVVTVYDNGIGIDLKKIKCIEDDNLESINNEKRNSIGLKNIKKRMEMIYNKNNLLKIEKLEKGTLITLTFPKERN